MLKKIYINNYRCFQNFELNLDELRAYLILGKNGSGKSTLVNFFEILKRIGEWETSLSTLISKKDFNLNQLNSPIEFEVELELNSQNYKYRLSIDFPEYFKSPRVLEEQLSCDDKPIISRNEGNIEYREQVSDEHWSNFFLDWHTLALPMLRTRHENGNIELFKSWLIKIVVLSPIPSQVESESFLNSLLLKPDYNAIGTASWLTGIFAEYPQTYNTVYNNLKTVMTDLKQIRNIKTSELSRKVSFVFARDNQEISVDLEQLSDGEKIFVIASLLSASIQEGEVSFCIWDEPDNYISLVEMESYFYNLKRAFLESNAQFLCTTHNPEAIRTFSAESIYHISRSGHLSPARVRLLNDENPEYDIVDMIKTGLIEL